MSLHSHLDDKLHSYYKNIMYMGTLVEQYLNEAIDVFLSHDTERARELIENDKRVDDMQIALEQESIMLLLLHSPVAKDLRKIVTSIKVVANLERIGDYAVHLSKLTLKSNTILFPGFIPRIGDMALKGSLMIRDSLTAYIEDNEELALVTAKRDKEIDSQKKEIISDLIMLSPKNEVEMKQIYRYLSICKDLERLGDHITTICEWVIFTVSGDIVDLNRQKDSI